ncbi:FAD synthetase family protein [Niallia sp. XMNu-256]|uniref:FAD synthetase family protein n=1 Tax=Niallia sp. XMNu-256 TaxID=3082444 RepID=UPI0030D5453F
METIYLNQDNLMLWQKKADLSVMALGFFDGVHKGHLKVIETAYQIAREKEQLLAVMSFFPHPKSVLSDGRKTIDYLMPLSSKEKLLSDLGVDRFYIVQFTKEFAALSPERFTAQYLLGLGVTHAVAGFDYTYGSKGIGNMDRLKDDSGGLLEVTKVSKVECRGEKISSTSLREKLAQGKVEEVSKLLGRPYEVECEWNGASLKVQPYYTLPRPGRYAITIKGDPSNQEVEVIVNEQKRLIPLNRMTTFLTSYRGPLTIKWHQQIYGETAMVEKKLIHII